MTKPITNIPMEVIRSFVAIADTGNLTRAAERLGLSQPAITAQMKKMQVLVGGPVLSKTAAGMVISELGKLLLSPARRILDNQDQILTIVGGGPDASLRVGVSALMLPTLLATGFRPTDQRMSLFAEHSREIRKGVVEGYIDIGCVFTSSRDESDIADLIVERESIPMVWVKSRDFTLSPGEAIPIISLPEDDYIIRPLQRAQTVYRIAMRSADMYARLAAIRGGVGIGAAPPGIVPDDVVVTSEYSLPEMAPVDAYVCVRESFDREDGMNVLPYLVETLRMLGRGP
jgi:DNA-binding transcriptional LysR family regulator